MDLPEVDPAHDNTDLTCKVCLVMPMVAVRGVTNTFQLGFEACSTEGDPYLVLNQMPRSEEAIATLILPNRPIVKLHSKCIFVYTHCSQPWSKKLLFAASIRDSEWLRALRIN